MNVIGIESSCDECGIAIVRNGREILSNVVASQVEAHKPFNGVVPEIASRLHIEWILSVYYRACDEANITQEDIHGIAVTNRPGLLGSLVVGLSFAKALSFSLSVPYIAIDHIKAHLYAPFLEYDIKYPFLGVLVSGGHTIIGIVRDYDTIEVLGTTIDDACGEAFDKVAKFYQFGYPGGVIIDKMSQKGDPLAFSFPDPSLHKGEHRYDVSYSGLKTAVVNQLMQFHKKGHEYTSENIAASFQKAAIDMLMKRIRKAITDTGITTVVVGGGVAANSYLRGELTKEEGLSTFFPSLKLCTDNGAMVAGIGYCYLKDDITSSLQENAFSRVPIFRKSYP